MNKIEYIEFAFAFSVEESSDGVLLKINEELNNLNSSKINLLKKIINIVL